MAERTQRMRLTLDSEATYRIRVQGCLEEAWSDRLAGMDITINIQLLFRAPETTITGVVKDQSELIGVLNGLYELRMPLLSLELISPEKESL